MNGDISSYPYSFIFASMSARSSGDRRMVVLDLVDGMARRIDDPHAVCKLSDMTIRRIRQAESLDGSRRLPYAPLTFASPMKLTRRQQRDLVTLAGVFFAAAGFAVLMTFPFGA
jgi:hypothetical protein